MKITLFSIEMVKDKTRVQSTMTSPALVLIALLFFIMLLPLNSHAATGGPDAYGYTWDDGVSHQWIDISGSGTLSSASNVDDGSAGHSMGFTFNYYGVNYTNINIGSNGMIGFVSTSMGTFANQSLPNASAPNGVIAGMWDDLNPSSGGNIYYETQGSVPNRVFIVQFQGVTHYGSGSTNTFQFRLYESTNEIIIAYNSYTGSGDSQGNSATVGIENETGTDGLSYSYNATFNPASLSILFSTGSSSSYTMSTDVPVATADSSTVISEIYLSDSGTVVDVNVIVNIDHDYLSSLSFALRAPDGTLVELSPTGFAGTAGSYTDTEFDDEASTAITSGSSPFSGSFIPSGSLADFDGGSITGTWKLEVTDIDGYGDTGTINSWGLDITEEVGTGSGVLLIWDINDVNMQALKTALENSGHVVTLSDTSEISYNGTNPAPTGFDAVIHMHGGTNFGMDMPSAGQTALVSYVQGGGTFIGSQLNGYEYSLNGNLQDMRDLILFNYTSYRVVSIGHDVVPAQSGHAVVAGVPATFNISSANLIESPLHTFASEPATTLITNSYGPTLAVRNLGSGCVVGFNLAINYYNAMLQNLNIQQLYINSVNWCSGTPVSVVGEYFSGTTAEDIQFSGTLTGTDAGGLDITFAVNTQPANGTVDITNTVTGAFTYMPDANYYGVDTFTFTVSTSVETSSPTTGSITVNSVNDLPVAYNSSFTADEDVAKATVFIGYDPVEGSSVTFSIVGGPSNGTVSSFNTSTGAYTYTSTSNYNGSDSITFLINDGIDDSNTATITITVNAVNDAPEAYSQAVVTDEDTLLEGTLTGDDPIEGDYITYSLSSSGTNGTAVVVNPSTGTFTYMPNNNFAGSDSFTFKTFDGVDYSTDATVDVTVTSVNDDPPVPTASQIITARNYPGTTQVSHNDPDVGDSHTFTVTTQGLNGVASVDSSGLATYTPNENFFGLDEFIITVTDSYALAGEVTITVSVEESDVNAPTDGVLTTVVGNSNVNLSWTDAVDDLTGIASYDIVVSTTGLPLVNCADGSVIYSGTDNSFDHSSADNGTTYYYRLCATDGYGNVSVGLTGIETPFTTEGLTIAGFDDDLQGIERIDGGDDSNNFDTDTSNPVVDLLYEFSIVLKDTAIGTTPASVKVYISSRLSPTVNELYAIDLKCVGDIAEGALCSGTTLLGPASDYSFYFTAVLGDGLTIVRFPSAANTYLTGPIVELLNGYMLVGLPRNISTANLDGTGAFTTPYSYRWLSTDMSSGSENKGAYDAIDGSGNPVVAGEGYFVYKDSGMTTIPSFDVYDENAPSSFTTRYLKQGWNIISNPFGGNVNLSDINLLSSSGLSLSWEEAAEEELVVNGIFYYNGTDWGDTYAFKSAGMEPDAVLTPWLGYWVYINDDVNIYKLVIPKP